MKDIKKELALLFAGALASVIGGIFLQPIVNKRLLWMLATVVVALILYGSGAVSKMFSISKLWRRKGIWLLRPKIGILNDMGWDAENNEIHAWTDISPKDWKEAIEQHAKEEQTRLKVKVELIDVKKSFDSYIAVLNPYGGVYPEQDLKTSQTLNKVFDYVNRGGVFINVSDIPGYWAYNTLLNRRLDSTPAIYGIDRTPEGRIGISSVRPFLLTPFVEKLGLQIHNVRNTELFHWNVHLEDDFQQIGNIDEIDVERVAVIEKNVVPIIKPKRFVSIDADITPFFLVNYGEGRFLVSLVFESSEKNHGMKDLIANRLIKLLRQEKSKEGRVTFQK